MRGIDAVIGAAVFCGGCLYLAVWVSGVPLAIQLVGTGTLTLCGAMLLDILFGMRRDRGSD